MGKHWAALVLLLLIALATAPALAQEGGSPVEIVIINTGDEHGWMQPFTGFGSTVVQGGAANILGWWHEMEQYDPESVLLLSSGDNWTGPSISTWFQGEPMIEAFNLMGYDASAIGNHEFDFGREVMLRRFDEATYPYLAANIRYASSGESVDFAAPYALFDVNGVTVGVLGLTTQDVPEVTLAEHISDLVFTDYAEAVTTYAPQMREAGAQVIVALSHVCPQELALLALAVGDMVDVMFAGHCNFFGVQEINDVTIVGSGERWHSYARVNITFDPASGEVQTVEPDLVRVEFQEADGNPVESDAEMLALVAEWQARTDAALAQEIGFTAQGMAQRSPAMQNWVTDAWLWAYPQADIAVTNVGGFRQAVDAGPITWADIVNVLPFENYIYVVEITGAQLAENLACCGGAVGGIRYARRGGRVEIEFLDERPFDPDETYTVLVSNFMYTGGDGYLFARQDSEPYDTALNWRQPVIDFTVSLPTSADHPLENFLDVTPRGG